MKHDPLPILIFYQKIQRTPPPPQVKHWVGGGPSKLHRPAVSGISPKIRFLIKNSVFTIRVSSVLYKSGFFFSVKSLELGTGYGEITEITDVASRCDDHTSNTTAPNDFEIEILHKYYLKTRFLAS